MKHCPTCNKTFTDQNLSFCIDDGTPLVNIAEAADEATVVSPHARKGGGGSGEADAYVPRDWQRDYQPPGSFEPAGQKRKVWPWVLGIVGVLIIGIIGLGILFTILAPRMLRANANSNNSNVIVERNEQNSDSNFNSTVPEANSNSANVNNNNAGINENAEAPAPTDSDGVLADLTAIEHEWTVANINADKKKLAQILADDYVGTSADGKSQGKAEYLKTIERDTSIEKWAFEDLKVALRGDRTTLTGKIRIQIGGQEAVYRFIDKFVWRDGRWQAVSSEVERES